MQMTALINDNWFYVRYHVVTLHQLIKLQAGGAEAGAAVDAGGDGGVGGGVVHAKRHLDKVICFHSRRFRIRKKFVRYRKKNTNERKLSKHFALFLLFRIKVLRSRFGNSFPPFLSFSLPSSPLPPASSLPASSPFRKSSSKWDPGFSLESVSGAARSGFVPGVRKNKNPGKK